ncbi:MAG: flagellar biosynthetic protein FliR [Pseudomonadota bacterium]|nr:flagellar biosynthetic protein FliR [Pseudomonadota bacterium]MEE3322965.1 flagellar biosynthetic protein FliR [Pseudomonadota bacterium]
MSELQSFITQGVFAFMLTFVRVGTAMMILPGLGDTLVPQQVRLYIALGFAFVLFPVTQAYMPNPLPGSVLLFLLIIFEFITGMFIGTVARIMMSALDVAGMIMSMMVGLGNAQLFNPLMSSQGSLLGAFLSIAGVTLLFVTNLHHLMLLGLLESYHAFPVGQLLQAQSMAEMIGQVVASSFRIGIQMSIPLIIIGTVMYIGMGVLARIMPQIQVFMLALPLQILIGFITLAVTAAAMLLFWLQEFENGLVFFLEQSF